MVKSPAGSTPLAYSSPKAVQTTGTVALCAISPHHNRTVSLLQKSPISWRKCFHLLGHFIDSWHARRVADSTVLPDLLHGNETRVWGDQAYRGQRAVIRQHATMNRLASAHHVIGVIKRVFCFAKVRYRGLKKNTHRLLVTCALANLFIVRRHLLPCQGA